MSQPRYNPRTQRDDWYYRIKESFLDLTGCVRSRVMHNVGFIKEKVHMRICSEPNKSADDIYEPLKYKKMPFRKIRIEKSL